MFLPSFPCTCRTWEVSEAVGQGWTRAAKRAFLDHNSKTTTSFTPSTQCLAELASMKTTVQKNLVAPSMSPRLVPSESIPGGEVVGGEVPFLAPLVQMHTQMHQGTAHLSETSSLPAMKLCYEKLYRPQQCRPEIPKTHPPIHHQEPYQPKRCRPAMANKTCIPNHHCVPKHFLSERHPGKPDLPDVLIHPSKLELAARTELPENDLLSPPEMDLTTKTTLFRLLPDYIPEPVHRSLQSQAQGMIKEDKAQTDIHRLKKSLNVDSPSFTPSTLSVPSKTSSISSQAANAAPFTPRSLASGATTPNPQPDPQPTFNPVQIREFTPQNYDLSEKVSVCLSSIIPCKTHC
jgi:hypothetical protein